MNVENKKVQYYEVEVHKTCDKTCFIGKVKVDKKLI